MSLDASREREREKERERERERERKRGHLVFFLTRREEGGGLEGGGGDSGEEKVEETAIKIKRINTQMYIDGHHCRWNTREHKQQ